MYGLHDPTRLARDAFYVSVGFGVLGFQKLQVRRRELERSIERAARDGEGPIGTVSQAASTLRGLLDQRRPA